MGCAALRHTGKPGTDLDTLDRVDTHHRVGDVGIHLVKQRLTQAHRHTTCHDTDARAAGVAGLAQRLDVGFQCRHILHRCEKRVARHMLPGLETNGQIADLRHAAPEQRAVLFI